MLGVCLGGWTSAVLALVLSRVTWRQVLSSSSSSSSSTNELGARGDREIRYVCFGALDHARVAFEWVHRHVVLALVRDTLASITWFFHAVLLSPLRAIWNSPYVYFAAALAVIHALWAFDRLNLSPNLLTQIVFDASTRARTRAVAEQAVLSVASTTLKTSGQLDAAAHGLGMGLWIFASALSCQPRQKQKPYVLVVLLTRLSMAADPESNLLLSLWQHIRHVWMLCFTAWLLVGCWITRSRERDWQQARKRKGTVPACVKPVEATEQDQFQQTACSICIVEFKATLQPSQLFCGHRFHDACIKEWLHYSDQCPLCRATVTPFARTMEVIFL